MTSRHLRYSGIAMALHWLIAALLLFQIGLGWRMDGPRGPETYAVFQLHKSIGITVLMLTLIRLAWRLTHRPPPLPVTLQPWEQRLAHVAHTLFYVLLLGLPLTGWLLVSASRVAIPTVLYGYWPWPHVPGVATLDPASKTAVRAAAEFGHQALAWAAYALIALHVAGALKHQFADRAGDMARMLPMPRRALGGATVAVVALALGCLALGNLVHLKPIPLAAPPAEPAPAPAPVAAPVAALAPTETPPPTEPAPTPEVTTAAVPMLWTVDRARSTLGFTSRWSEGPIDGHFERWYATIRFNPDALAQSSVRVTIDMASARTGVTDTEGALPEDDWFATKTHPRAVFTARVFRHLGGDRYEARGSLDLRGVTRPLVLPFTLTISGRTANMTGEARIDRTSFGVGQGEWAATDDVPALVTVTVRLVAETAQPISTTRSK